MPNLWIGIRLMYHKFCRSFKKQKQYRSKDAHGAAADLADVKTDLLEATLSTSSI